MPAKSQQQQKLMGLALSVKKKDTPASKVSQAVKDMVKNMSKKELEKYAGTKHKGLPKKVEEAKATLCGRCGHKHVKGTPCPRPFKENQEMDPVDTITMDIPLFLRMLEFAREDASQDMDLHDVTERANMLTKDRGLLSMKDYEEIVKAAKDINEAFSKEYDEDPALKGKQKGLPDALQKAIIAKANKKLKEAEVSPAERAAAAAEKTALVLRKKAIEDELANLQKRGLTEGREFDYEGSMARTQLYSIIKNAKALFDQMDERTQLQGWVQSKLTKAEDYIDAVRTYLEGESLTSTTPLVVSEEMMKDEEGASLNIGDVVKAGDGGIYQVIYSYGEAKPFLVPFDLKKRKPTNLRNRIYFDEDSMIVRKLHKVMPFSQTKGGFMK